MPGITEADHIAEDELAAWVAFTQLSGAGLRTQRVVAIYEHLGSLAYAWQASRDQLRFVPGLSRDAVDRFVDKRRDVNPEQLMEAIRRKQIQAVPYPHPSYPFALKQITDPPLVLFVRGSFQPDDLRAVVGVVGTRRPTAYGQRQAKEVAGGLARNGVTVVSGMAVGIDSFAHRAAIEAGGRTIAVLGCGPDICYPSSNKPLYEMLISGEHGAVISEYFPGTPPDTWRFPERNRIISGLSHALVVIEAGQKSGALITAELAFQQSREVFALPGRVDSPMSVGTHWLIVNLKARLMRSYEDVLNDQNWASGAAPEKEAPARVVELYGREKEVYDVLSHEPLHFDVLCERTGMSAGELSATLTMLELAGVVIRHPGDSYSRQ